MYVSAKLKAGQWILFTWKSIKSTTCSYLNLSIRFPVAPEIIKVNAILWGKETVLKNHKKRINIITVVKPWGIPGNIK